MYLTYLVQICCDKTFLKNFFEIIAGILKVNIIVRPYNVFIK